MRHSGGCKGGMQSCGVSNMYCKCGKPTSKILQFLDGSEISIHFGRKKTYWHIYENGKIRIVFIMPERWKQY
jgi:hypothetical protein